MTARLLSARPVADDYRSSLKADIAEARLVRFAMAYVSQDGLDGLGIPTLLDALTDPDSFGLATLHCGCGFEPLFRLQELLGQETVRLKYFVDPQIGGRDLAEPSLELLHSKLVYLVRGDRAIVYIGSHNWSGRALGPGSPRNAEASMRMEFEFDERQLDGRGSDLPSQVNKHLLYVWSLGICRPATEVNRTLFEEWRLLCCTRADPAKGRDRYAVVSAVCDVAGPPFHRSPAFWQSTVGKRVGIYFQLHEEKEGRVLRELQDRVLVLVWASQVDLQLSVAPGQG